MGGGGGGVIMAGLGGQLKSKAAGLSYQCHLDVIWEFIVNLFSWVPNLDTAKAVIPYT